MPHLLLVRHSEPEIIPGIPASQWHLSEEGIRRAELLAGQLLTYNLQHLISSTEPKAFETTQIISNRLGILLETHPNLHEHMREGVSFTTRQEFISAIERLFTHPNDLVMGNETANQAYDRFSLAVDEVMSLYPAQNSAIVSHGTVISLFVSHRCGLQPFEIWQRLGMPACIILSLPDMKLSSIIDTIT